MSKEKDINNEIIEGYIEEIKELGGSLDALFEENDFSKMTVESIIEVLEDYLEDVRHQHQGQEDEQRKLSKVERIRNLMTYFLGADLFPDPILIRCRQGGKSVLVNR